MQNNIEKRIIETKKAQDTAWQRIMKARNAQAQEYIKAEQKLQQVARSSK